MSKERALRRAERERVAEAEAAARAARDVRFRRRTTRRQAVARLLPRATTRPSGILAERRRTRRRLLVAALVLVQLLVWLFLLDPVANLAALVVSLLLFPLLLAVTQ